MSDFTNSWQLHKDAFTLEDPPNHQVEYEPETNGEDVGQNNQNRSLNSQMGQLNSLTPPEMIPTLRTATGNSRKIESPEGQKILHFARFKCRPKASLSRENNQCQQSS